MDVLRTPDDRFLDLPGFPWQPTYATTSDGDSAHNPSRTTVANDGSVWSGNRNQSSVIHVGLVETGQCEDRNGNGAIETSTGYGDVSPKTTAGQILAVE